MPSLSPDDAAPLGYVRRAGRHLRHGDDLRRRQRCRRARSRAGSTPELAFLADGHAVRLQERRRSDAGLERPEYLRPQLPHQLQQHRVRRRLRCRHAGARTEQSTAGRRPTTLRHPGRVAGARPDVVQEFGSHAVRGPRRCRNDGRHGQRIGWSGGGGGRARQEPWPRTRVVNRRPAHLE